MFYLLNMCKHKICGAVNMKIQPSDNCHIWKKPAPNQYLHVPKL